MGLESFLGADSKIVYFYVPGGYGKSELNNSFIERKSNTIATTRNVNTLIAIANMMNN
ncbi:MAG: hypothetical protein PF505_01875 [Vallitaleaceae bacterium]|nr:hypothetical protein [Vallitaleaceae bacterium]